MVIHIYSIVNTKSMYIYLIKIENSGVAKATLGLNVGPSLLEREPKRFKGLANIPGGSSANAKPRVNRGPHLHRDSTLGEQMILRFQYI
jgi:hypothetical protein